MRRFRKTLIVDDDPVSRFLTRMMLEELHLCEEIIELYHGKAALEYIQKNCMGNNEARENCPDWILLDLNMPVMNGVELLVHLQELKQSSLIEESVTILTSSANPQDIFQVNTLGVKKYFTKPLTEPGMEAFLNEFLARGGSH